MTALQVFFGCEIQGQHCKHLHKGSEFQSSYSSLYYMASENVGMWSGLHLLEISGWFSYMSLILKHPLTAHKVLCITSFQCKDFCPNVHSWSIWGQISTTAQWNGFSYQFHSYIARKNNRSCQFWWADSTNHWKYHWIWVLVWFRLKSTLKK